MTSFLEPGLGFTPGLFSSSSEDPDVTTFLAALDANSEPYSQGEASMLNGLTQSLKAQSLWDLVTLLWVPVGQNIAATMYALKHPDGVGTEMTNVNFVQGDWDRTAGLYQDVSTKRIDTLTTEEDYAPSNDTHIMAISETAGVGGSRRDVGVTTQDRFQLIISFSGSGFYRSFSPATAIEGVSVAGTDGVFIATKNNDNAIMLRNDTVVSNQTVSSSTDTPTTDGISIFIANNSASLKRLGAVSIGQGLTLAQMQAYEDILQSLRTTRAAL